MYRNKIDLTSKQGVIVDAGSLWRLKDGIMVLVDEDQHITSDYNSYFEEAID